MTKYRKPARILVMGFYGRRNFGDDIMAHALSDHLVVHTSAQIIVAMDGSYAKHAFASDRVSIVPRDLRTILREIARCDVLIQGGGTIFHDSFTKTARRRYWINLGAWFILFALAKILRTRVLVLGAGVGPLGHWVSRCLSRAALRLADTVNVRDRASVATMASLGLTSTTTRGYDLATLAAEAAVPARNHSDGKIVISVCPCSLTEFVEDDLVRTRYWGELGEALKRLGLHRTVHVRLIALYTGAGMVSDLVICSQLAKQLAGAVNVEIIDYPRPISEINAALASSDLIVSAKFHGLLVSYLLGRRVVGVAYNRKVVDLGEEIGLPPELVLPVSRVVSADEWVAVLEETLDQDIRPTLSVSAARRATAAVVDSAAGLAGLASSADCSTERDWR